MQPTGTSPALNLLSQYDYNIPNLQQTAEQSASKASQYGQAADLLPAQLKQAIQEKLNYNQDLITQQNDAQAKYFAAPSTARNQYQDIANPFQREQLVSQATANAYAPYKTLGDILAQRQGSISDIVQQGTGAFNSQVRAQQDQAQQDQSAYQNAIQLAQWLYGVQHQGGSYQQTKDAQAKQTQADLIDDVRKGATVNQVMQAYGTEVDPTEILRLYNLYEAPKSAGGYGPSQETPDVLQKLYGIQPAKGQGTTPEEITTLAQQHAAGKVTVSQIPAAIRAQVLDESTKYKTQSIWDKLGGLFK